MSMLAEKKKWRGLLLAIIMPGLGHVYSNEWLRGGCYLILFSFLPLLLIRLVVELPDSLLVVGTASVLTLVLVVYIYSLLDVLRILRKDNEHMVVSTNIGPVFYLAYWLVGMVCIVGVEQYLKQNMVQAFKIVTNTMAPTVLQGDYVLSKKPPYRNRPIKIDDVVIVVYPDDRSKVLIRQIVGLPGQIIKQSDEPDYTVPHGMAFIKGTQSKSLDSTTFGPVDLRDIVGRVTQVYFSKTEDGIRWGRLLKQINK